MRIRWGERKEGGSTTWAAELGTAAAEWAAWLAEAAQREWAAAVQHEGAAEGGGGEEEEAVQQAAGGAGAETAGGRRGRHWGPTAWGSARG